MVHVQVIRPPILILRVPAQLTLRPLPVHQASGGIQRLLVANQSIRLVRPDNHGIQSAVLVNLQPRLLIPHIRPTLLTAAIAEIMFVVQARQLVLVHQTAEEELLLTLLTRQLNIHLILPVHQASGGTVLRIPAMLLAPLLTRPIQQPFTLLTRQPSTLRRPAPIRRPQQLTHLRQLTRPRLQPAALSITI